MVIKHIVTLGLLLLLVSCAKVEPPRVENGLYINPAYQFSLRVPDGWEVSEQGPISLKKELSFLTNKKIKTTFSDFSNKCFILVAAERTEMDWTSFKMYDDKFTSSLDSYYAREKKKYAKDPDVQNYQYEIYTNQIENCAGNCIAAKLEFQAQDLMVTGHNIVYKSNSQMLYTVTLILISREQQQASNVKIYQTVVDSFQHR